MSAARRLIALALVVATSPASAVEWNTPESRARWAEISDEVFGTVTKLEKTDRLVTVSAPGTAADAALVPVAIKVDPSIRLRDLSLVIDQNPAPLAAKVIFGAAGDPRLIGLRVRVDGFTNMHAVAATEDGRLLQSAVFVKGAGGCSAPMGMSVTEASVGMGDMKMKFATNGSLGDAPQATLMIRHPNFNGMQKDPATREYTPSRFIKSITVTRGSETVFSMTSDISLSTNPVIDFLYKPAGSEPFTVTVIDTADGTWKQQFVHPEPMAKGIIDSSEVSRVN